jgi:serine/threonine protein phosphatase PrpC
LAGTRSLAFASEQAEGGATPRFQGDRLQLSYVRTRDGQEVLLGVVADGGRSPRGTQAAETTIRSVVEAVSRSQSDGLSRTLAAGLQSAAAAWKSSLGEASAPVEVSATAVCVFRRRLYAAHAGQSGAFLVRGGQAYPLMKATGPLGSIRPPDAIAGAKDGLELQPGDWVMIASDGLTRTSSETRRPFVEAAEIPSYLQGSEPREAARHLISIALGRDADDNISVGLIRLPGTVQRKSLRPVAWGVAAVAFILMGGLVVSTLINRPAQTLAEFGYAVVLEGSGLAEVPGEEAPLALGHLDLIPAGAMLRSSSPMQLSLQSTARERGGLLVAALILATDTQIEIVQLDAYPGGASSNQALPPAIFEVQSGRLMVRLEESRRALQIRMADGVVLLDKGNPAVLGADFGSDVFDCLSGTCRVEPRSSGEIVLGPGERVELSSGSRVALSPSDLEAWRALCAECVVP